MTRTEAHNYFEGVYNVRCDEFGIQSGERFLLNVCGKATIAGQEVCLDTGSVQTSGRECDGTTTYPEVSIDVDLKSYEFDGDDRGSVNIDVGFWVGVTQDPYTGELCLEIGQEESGVCMTNCTPNGSWTVAAYAEVTEAWVNFLQEYVFTKEVGYTIITLLIVILVAIAEGVRCTVGAGCSA